MGRASIKENKNVYQLKKRGARNLAEKRQVNF